MGTRTYAYIGLGSNLGDRITNFRDAVKHIQKRLGNVIEYSRVYETEPLGFYSEHKFFNAVVKIIPKPSPGNMIKEIKEIENEMGRVQRKKDEGFSDRIIDIDILIFGSKIYKSGNVNIPHNKIADRTFVLRPLVDIAPNVIVPGYNMTTVELLGLRHDFDTVKLTDYKI